MISSEIFFARASSDWSVAEPPLPERSRSGGTPNALSPDQLLSAVRDGHMLPFYQPIADLKQGTFIAAEALARCYHPTEGLLSASDFLMHVGDGSLTREIFQSLLDRSLQDWGRLGGFFSDFGLSINLAPAQLADRHFAGRLIGSLAVNDVPARLLTLEIGNISALPKGADTGRSLGQLRQAGINLALDNFGVCPGALVALRDLPFNKVKLDRTFVTDADCHREKRKILTWFAKMSQDLEIEVHAEGIETHSCLDLVRSVGIEFGQGFLLGRPMAFERLRGVDCTQLNLG